jgi:hypothetical protein
LGAVVTELGVVRTVDLHVLQRSIDGWASNTSAARPSARSATFSGGLTATTR